MGKKTCAKSSCSETSGGSGEYLEGRYKKPEHLNHPRYLSFQTFTAITKSAINTTQLNTTLRHHEAPLLPLSTLDGTRHQRRPDSSSSQTNHRSQHHHFVPCRSLLQTRHDRLHVQPPRDYRHADIRCAEVRPVDLGGR